MPKVSVIIPSFNYARFVANAVDSVLAQTFTDHEIIVIDDGSTDNTREILSVYKGRINYIYQENKGLSGARNTGIRAAKGEWIALLDADDEWYPNKLEEQMRVLGQNPQINIIFSDYVIFNDSGVVKESNPPPKEFFKETNRLLERNNGAVLIANIFQELILVGCCITTLTSIFKKDLAQKVGLFNESLRMCEDYEFWLRCSRDNVFCYLNKVLAKCFLNSGGMSGIGMRRNVGYSYGEAQAIELNWSIIPDDIRNKVKARLLQLYFDAVWGSYKIKDYHVCVREALRSLRLNPFQFKVIVYLFLSIFKSL
jgi:glycosyltransferase involved in cell wall biosynthesis